MAISQHVLAGLEAAHQIGVVHRDIKPANILVTEQTAKIIDFSIARLDENDAAASSVLTATGILLGTPHYMAPEQLSTSKVDYRADLYAFGVTLFHMLTGQTPFTGDSAMAVLKEKMQGEAPAPSSLNRTLPKELDEVVLQLPQRERKDRQASAGAVAKQLRPFG